MELSMSTTNLSRLVTAIQSVDPAKIKKLYPSTEQFDEYVRLKQAAQSLVNKVEPGGLPPELTQEIKALSESLRNLSNQISPNTELGGKLLTNEIVIWAESHHLERAIYLAGICHNRNIKEPYRTQIRLQPANACMTRYHQIFNVVEWIKGNIHADPPGRTGHALASMLRALLEQFEYFSERAHEDNPKHVYGSYMMALAKLFKAHENAAIGNSKGSEKYSDSAKEIVNNIPEPTGATHKVELIYHQKNWEEFEGFSHLCEKHRDVANRLAFLASKAKSLLEAGGGKEEPCFFWFSSYVGGMARAGSVVGLICAIAGALGIDFSEARDAIEKTWHIVAESIPGLGPLDANIVTAVHTGGLAGPEAVALHTGGLTNTFNLAEMKMMLHTGGLV
jgi:hypothetical protein